MHPIAKLAPMLAFLSLAGCDYPPIDQPKSVEDLGIATPAHPVNNPNKLEATAGAPMQLPVPSPAVSRTTDAGATSATGPIEEKE